MILQIKYGALIILFLGIILTSVYYLLGGFDELKVYKVEGANYTVAGRYFEGRYNDRLIEKYFKESRSLLDEERIDGTLAIISYQKDTIKDYVSYFVGIILEKDMVEIPRGFRIREFMSTSRYVVFLSMHSMVRPPSKKIEALIINEAEKYGDQLEDFTIELYYKDESMSVEQWVR